MAISISGTSGITFPSGLVQSDSAGFSSGTVMLFVQTSAPTGWTKSTTHDNKSLRVVSGTAGSGGSVDFTTAFASQTPTGTVSVSGTVGSTTLTTSQIPSHTHPAYGGGSGGTGAYASWSSVTATTNHASAKVAAAEGGGGSHNHSFSGSGSFTGTAMDLTVKYVDVIIATKN